MARIPGTILLLLILVLSSAPQPPALASAPAAAALTNIDVIRLSRLGISDELIVQIIDNAGNTAFATTPLALRRLRSNGVSGRIVNAVIKRSRPGWLTANAISTETTDELLANASTPEVTIFGEMTELSSVEGLENLFMATLNVQPVTCGAQGGFSTVLSCHKSYPAGCSPAEHPKYDAYLNVVKNIVPTGTAKVSGRIASRQQLATLEKNTYGVGLTTRNHGEKKGDLAGLGEGRFVTLEGVLYYAFVSNGSDANHPEGETCNCDLTAEDAADYHIGIGFAPFPLPDGVLNRLRNEDARKVRKSVSFSLLEQNAMVVEMTPHVRKLLFPKWTILKLQKWTGSPVRLIGQLMIDNAHYSASQDCLYPHADMKKCWRLSAWELHPVTRFEVCTQTTASGCAAGHWTGLENLP